MAGARRQSTSPPGSPELRRPPWRASPPGAHLRSAETNRVCLANDGGYQCRAILHLRGNRTDRFLILLTQGRATGGKMNRISHGPWRQLERLLCLRRAKATNRNQVHCGHDQLRAKVPQHTDTASVCPQPGIGEAAASCESKSICGPGSLDARVAGCSYAREAIQPLPRGRSSRHLYRPTGRPAEPDDG
jgi:hypothetical protein